jgi:hypothetical protein
MGLCFSQNMSVMGSNLSKPIEKSHMFLIQFDDDSITRIWCKPSKIDIESIKLQYYHSSYYNRNYTVKTITDETVTCL